MGAAEQAMGGGQAPADPEQDPDDAQPGHEQSESAQVEAGEDAGEIPDEENT